MFYYFNWFSYVSSIKQGLSVIVFHTAGNSLKTNRTSLYNETTFKDLLRHALWKFLFASLMTKTLINCVLFHHACHIENVCKQYPLSFLVNAGIKTKLVKERQKMNHKNDEMKSTCIFLMLTLLYFYFSPAACSLHLFSLSLSLSRSLTTKHDTRTVFITLSTVTVKLGGFYCF